MTRPSFQRVLLIAATLALPSAALAHGSSAHPNGGAESLGFFAGLAHFFGAGAHWALPLASGLVTGVARNRSAFTAGLCLSLVASAVHAGLWSANAFAAGMGLSVAYAMAFFAANRLSSVLPILARSR